MGDTDQGWYVPQELLQIYREKIIPLAKFCVPNQVKIVLTVISYVLDIQSVFSGFLYFSRKDNVL
jgi:pyridoxal/pyridoxine/pyridoxamine kinase